MGAAPDDRDVWALKVDADDPRTPSSGERRIDGAVHDLRRVGDEGGKDRHGAEAAMGARDGLHAGDGRLGVEQHPPSAVHLKVDIAGSDEARNDLRVHSWVPRREVDHAASIEAEGEALVQALAVEEAIRGDPGHASGKR
ncbi:hypothetical protein [Rubellimicrobium mesophilum]|uniref:hypothetical protein n=1 Tax=Rubellimicrobium mesophilum TaxID=1123067 RepID=UPI001FE1F1AF|nr:hypothetical protein [Rubellimicrobium mesophilum]